MMDDKIENKSSFDWATHSSDEYECSLTLFRLKRDKTASGTEENQKTHANKIILITT